MSSQSFDKFDIIEALLQTDSAEGISKDNVEAIAAILATAAALNGAARGTTTENTFDSISAALKQEVKALDEREEALVKREIAVADREKKVEAAKEMKGKRTMRHTLRAYGMSASATTDESGAKDSTDDTKRSYSDGKNEEENRAKAALRCISAAESLRARKTGCLCYPHESKRGRGHGRGGW
jgi:hypothetical protein